MRDRCLGLALMLGLSLGCSGDRSDARRKAERVGSGAHQAGIVSRVDGSPIAARDVEQLALAGQLSPELALRRLQAEVLLADEAERRGYAAQPQPALASRQAKVQALLARDVEAVDVSDSELNAAYESQRARFEQPERRRATHVLAAFSRAQGASASAEAAARQFIERVIARLQDTSDRAATLASLRTEGAEVQARVEDLPLAAADGTFVPAFTHALFSVAEPGVVPQPVRTEYGYHAIVVTEIVAATLVPRADALQTLRAEIAVTKRQARMTGLLQQLQGRTRVKYAPDTQQQLASLEF